MLRSPPMTSSPPPCFTYFSSSSLRAGANRFQIPVVENDQLIRRQIAAGEIVHPVDVELRGRQRRRQMRIHGPRVLRYIKNLRPPQHHGLIVPNFALAPTPNRNRQIQRSRRIQRCMQPHRILARLQLHVASSPARAPRPPTPPRPSPPSAPRPPRQSEIVRP